jgi:hypothetical protein
VRHARSSRSASERQDGARQDIVRVARRVCHPDAIDSERVRPPVHPMTPARGAATGCIATVAMSVPMLAARRLRLIDRQPPEEVTGRLAAAGGVPMRGGSLDAATAAAHMAFGAAAGALFAMARRPLGALGEGAWVGPAFGILVWALAYRLVLPRVGLVRGTEHAGWRRDVVMLVAHLVYGMVLGRLDQGR